MGEGMSQESETPLERAQHYLAEGEARVARQAALVTRFREQGRDTGRAERFLTEFQRLLAEMRQLQRALRPNGKTVSIRGEGAQMVDPNAAGGPDALERLVRAGVQYHREQMTLLVRLRTRGADTTRARRVLAALEDCLDVICGHQQQLLTSRGPA